MPRSSPTTILSSSPNWSTRGGKKRASIDVLPLDDRILERFLVSPPNPVTDRRRFVYYPGAYIPTEAMPDVRNVSFEIGRGSIVRRDQATA